MTGWIVAACLLVLLVVLLLLRVGVQVEYSPDLFAVRVRIGARYVQVVPAVPKEKPKPKKQKSGKGKPAKKTAKKRNQLELIRALLPPILRAIKSLCGKLRVDKLELVLTAGAEDPSDAAMQYGIANAILGTLWQPIVDTCHVVDGHARVEIDFEAKQYVIYLLAEPTLRVGQLLAIAAVFAVQALVILVRRTQETPPK